MDLKTAAGEVEKLLASAPSQPDLNNPWWGQLAAQLEKLVGIYWRPGFNVTHQRAAQVIHATSGLLPALSNIILDGAPKHGMTEQEGMSWYTCLKAYSKLCLGLADAIQCYWGPEHCPNKTASQNAAHAKALFTVQGLLELGCEAVIRCYRGACAKDQLPVYLLHLHWPEHVGYLLSALASNLAVQGAVSFLERLRKHYNTCLVLLLAAQQGCYNARHRRLLPDTADEHISQNRTLGAVVRGIALDCQPLCSLLSGEGAATLPEVLLLGLWSTGMAALEVSLDSELMDLAPADCRFTQSTALMLIGVCVDDHRPPQHEAIRAAALVRKVLPIALGDLESSGSGSSGGGYTLTGTGARVRVIRGNAPAGGLTEISESDAPEHTAHMIYNSTTIMRQLLLHRSSAPAVHLFPHTSLGAGLRLANGTTAVKPPDSQLLCPQELLPLMVRVMRLVACKQHVANTQHPLWESIYNVVGVLCIAWGLVPCLSASAAAIILPDSDASLQGSPPSLVGSTSSGGLQQGAEQQQQQQQQELLRNLGVAVRKLLQPSNTPSTSPTQSAATPPGDKHMHDLMFLMKGLLAFVVHSITLVTDDGVHRQRLMNLALRELDPGLVAQWLLPVGELAIRQMQAATGSLAPAHRGVAGARGGNSTAAHLAASSTAGVSRLYAVEPVLVILQMASQLWAAIPVPFVGDNSEDGICKPRLLRLLVSCADGWKLTTEVLRQCASHREVALLLHREWASALKLLGHLSCFAGVMAGQVWKECDSEHLDWLHCLLSSGLMEAVVQALVTPELVEPQSAQDIAKHLYQPCKPSFACPAGLHALAKLLHLVGPSTMKPWVKRYPQLMDLHERLQTVADVVLPSRHMKAMPKAVWPGPRSALDKYVQLAKQVVEQLGQLEVARVGAATATAAATGAAPSPSASSTTTATGASTGTGKEALLSSRHSWEALLAQLHGPEVGCWDSGCTNLEGPSEGKGKKCGRCGTARYCSPECQKAAWTVAGHKGMCGRLLAFKAAREAVADGADGQQGEKGLS